MTHMATVSIDVSDMNQALNFYTQALGCEFKKKYSDEWQVIAIGALDIHLQQKAAGTVAAGEHRRDYRRHWTPVHLDFIVEDIRPTCSGIEAHGGSVEKQTYAEQADIAYCADPFGNGFCVIRE
ncbi:VOC family protein [Sulfidibacter corallicola]|uniref:VOC family protein n=1 Tax=Sulfidibacter corallicola TaxID=2818388 RepID=A0A8A4TMD0_SULCO|nr:VOC family protein [Sulfidibacter corallicola]QTD50048.1 VOC family protein [Sulfidibacter corallicola]